MAKFCTSCGQPLREDGTCANCGARFGAPQQQYQQPPQQQYQQPPQQQYQQPPQQQYQQQPPYQQYQQPPYQQPGQMNEHIQAAKAATRQVLPHLKTYWAEPMKTTKKVMQENNTPLALVLMVIHMLATGLLLFFTLNSVGEAIKDIAGSKSKKFIEIPFLSSLLWGMLVGALALALSALVLFVLMKVMKSNASFQQMLIAVGVNSIPCTVCMLLALVCVVLEWVTPLLIVLVLSVVLWLTVGVMVLVKVLNVETNGLMVTLTAVFGVAMLFVNAWLGMKFELKAIGQIEVAGDKIEDYIDDVEDALDELSEMDMEDLVEAISRF